MRSTLFTSTKRALDVVGAATLIVATAPVQGLVALMVRAKLGSPVLFKQQRPGLHGRVFLLRKFRTMLPVDHDRNLVTNEDRMHPFGQFLRSTSLDELPSLWNVLVGDMSFVGPRPLRTHYLPRYSSYHLRRHEVRPGLTGLAQVRGRNALSWNDRLDLDVQYVENASLLFDFMILCRTIQTVATRTGVKADGQATMSEFLGSGPTIRHRPLRPQDLGTRVEWLNHPAVREGASISFEATLPDTQTWFEAATKDATRADYVCVDSNDDLVSMFGFVNRQQTRAELYVYVDPTRHGQGFGRLTMVQLLKAAEALELETLDLQTKSTNTTALRLYARFGFAESGRTSEGKVKMTRRSARPTSGGFVS